MPGAQQVQRTIGGSAIGDQISLSPGMSVHHFESPGGRHAVAALLEASATPEQKVSFGNLGAFAKALKLPIARTDSDVVVVGIKASGTLEHLSCLNWKLEKRIEVFVRLASVVKKIHDKGLTLGPFTPQDVILDESFYPCVVFPQIQPFDGPYAAPEALQRSRATDIYSLGSILHYIVSGRVPRFGDSIVPRLPDLENYPAGLARIVRKATCRSVGVRYSTVQAMLDEIAIYGRYKEVGVLHPDADERNLSGLSRLPMAPMPTTKVEIKDAELGTDDEGTSPLVEPLQEIGGGSAKLGGWRVIAVLVVIIGVGLTVMGWRDAGETLAEVTEEELREVSLHLKSASLSEGQSPIAYIQIADSWTKLSVAAQRAEARVVFDRFFANYGASSGFIFQDKSVLAHERNRHITFFAVWK